MDKTSKIALALVIVGVLIGGAVMIKGEKVEVKKEQTVSYKEATKEVFMGECASTEGYYAYCNCAFEELYSDLGASGFSKLSMDYAETEVMPESALETIAVCFDKLK